MDVIQGEADCGAQANWKDCLFSNWAGAYCIREGAIIQPAKVRTGLDEFVGYPSQYLSSILYLL